MTQNPEPKPNDNAKKLNFNTLLNQQHVYRNSVFKNAHYLIKREDFKQSIRAAQKALGLDKNPSDAHSALMWAFTTTPRTNNDNWEEKVNARYDLMQTSVNEVIKEYNLGREWKGFIEGLLLQSSLNDRPWMPLALKLEVVSVVDGEILIKLRPGLRYEEYHDAWKQIAPILGKGQRLNKPYTNHSEHLKMYEDKMAGMTYKEISEKYYPNNPSENFEKVKKAILRIKKRQERDK